MIHLVKFIFYAPGKSLEIAGLFFSEAWTVFFCGMCILYVYINLYFIRLNILSCTCQTWKPNSILKACPLHVRDTFSPSLNHVIAQGVLDSNHSEKCWCIYIYIYLNIYIHNHTYIYRFIYGYTQCNLMFILFRTGKLSRVHLSNCQRRHICKLSLLHDLYELNGPWLESASWVGQRSIKSPKMNECPLKKEHV